MYTGGEERRGGGGAFKHVAGCPQIARHRDEFTAPATWILVKHEAREIRELSTTILNHKRDGEAVVSKVCADVYRRSKTG